MRVHCCILLTVCGLTPEVNSLIPTLQAWIRPRLAIFESRQQEQPQQLQQQQQLQQTPFFGEDEDPQQVKPLATEGDWAAFLDNEETGLVYYFNVKTRQSVWLPPTDTFPEVKLKGRMRREARQKMEEYVRAAALLEEQGQKKNFFFSLLEGDEAPVEKEKPSKKQKKQAAKDEGDWFKFLFEYRRARQQQEEQAKKKAEKETKPKELFAGSFLSNIFSNKPRPLEEIIVPDTFTTAVIEQPLVEQPAKVAEPVTLEMASYILPAPDKIRWGGEDAVFYHGRTFGVFDGVTGADKLEGIPLYSKILAKEFKENVKENVGEKGLDLASIIRILTECAKTAEKIATGASTAIIGSISEDGYLRVLNVGDARCIVIRNGKVVGRARETFHYFGCPYQLSESSPDKPSFGSKLNMELVQGDIVFMASDGVFDNLPEEQVAEMVGSGPRILSVIAKRVVEQARKISTNKKAETPYAKQAQRFGDADYVDGVGGKVDDISCVVVRYGVTA